MPRGGDTSSLRAAAYEEIKHRIITCQFRPGEVLSEAVVSAELKIGRTPVHQAFDRLMVEGLVDILPRKGIVVRPLSLDEALDIIEVRLINEVHCVRLAAERAQPPVIRMLEDNLQRFAIAVSTRDIAQLMRLDREFHDTLSHAAGNPVLGDLLRNLHNRSLRFWFVSLRAPDHHQRVLTQHSEIVAAIRAHDPEQAAQSMRTHIEAFRANIMRQL